MTGMWHPSSVPKTLCCLIKRLTPDVHSLSPFSLPTKGVNLLVILFPRSMHATRQTLRLISFSQVTPLVESLISSRFAFSSG